MIQALGVLPGKPEELSLIFLSKARAYLIHCSTLRHDHGLTPKNLIGLVSVDGKIFQLNVSDVGVYPFETPFMCSPLWKTPDLASNVRLPFIPIKPVHYSPKFASKALAYQI
jgi:hypothetical protein